MKTCLFAIISLSLVFIASPWTARAGWLDDALRPVDVVFTQYERVLHTSQYRRTAAALAELSQVAHIGGWPLVGSGRPLMHPGASDLRVPMLRSRLGLPATVENDSALYDPALVAAVLLFQERHGLTSDGIVGRRTTATLDVPADVRTEQLMLNLQRLHHLPPDRGPRYVLVNVAAGTLAMVADDTVRVVMRTVVGRPDRQTPELAGSITELELNPTWAIPQKLARLDVLPLLQANPEYLREQNIRVFETWRDDAAELDPALIDWLAVQPETFNYRLLQAPGPLNPLGVIKFLFDNPYSVIIHDTPNPGKFDLSARFYSSGCVRIEDPDALADFLLQGADERLHAQIAAARSSDLPARFELPHPVPVYLVYWTAWVGDDGIVQFRDDVYDRDSTLPVAVVTP
jgi:L,D-transpeptidase YcbB